VAVDRSEGFAAFARARLPADRCRVLVGDAAALPVPDGAFDVVVSGLMLNFLPEPSRGVAEMARAARPGGWVAAYVWDYADGMQMLRSFWDAAVALDPAARELDGGRRFPICAPMPLAALMREALAGVEVRPIDVPAVFRDLDDLWTPFLGGQGPAPSYVASLDEEARGALRERLRATLPAEADGSIALTARAWAARGRAPG
jgi:SAM-dependent methyltransferase